MDLSTGREAPLGAVAQPKKVAYAAASVTNKQKKPTLSSLSQGPTPNMVVQLDLQVMLRVAALCKEDPTVIVHGELVGLNVAAGQLEITNCFATPTRRDVWNPRERPDMRELEEKHKKEVEKYRAKVRELMHYVDADCQSLGWFQTMPCSGLIEPAYVEELFQRVSTVDRNSIILTFDHERDALGRFPFRAFQLSEEFFALKKKQECNEINLQQMTRSVGQADILVELIVKAKAGVANDSLLLHMRPTPQVRSDKVSRTFVTAGNWRETALKASAATLDELVAEGDRLIRYQKDSSRFHQNLRRNIERKRAENEQRRQAGEETVGVEEEEQLQYALQSFEKRVEAPNPIKTMLIRRNVSARV